jgi:hypothetical protein
MNESIFGWIFGIAKSLLGGDLSLGEAIGKALAYGRETTTVALDEEKLTSELFKTIIQETERTPLSELPTDQVIPEQDLGTWELPSRSPYRALIDLGYFDENEEYHHVGYTTRLYKTNQTLEKLYKDADSQLELISHVGDSMRQMTPEGRKLTVGTLTMYAKKEPEIVQAMYSYEREGD